MAERGSGSTRDPLEALVTPLVIRPSVRRILLLINESTDTDTDTGHVNPTRRPRPTNLRVW